MGKFTDWFGSKLITGKFPVMEEIEKMDFDYIVNVSDEFFPDINDAFLGEGIKTFWFPMNEQKRDIGLNSIYGAMVILCQAEYENAKVYLHCHSGRNRSRIVYACYFYMRTGIQLPDGNGKYINRLHRASLRGLIPPQTEMELFLYNIEKELTKPMEGGIIDKCKIASIRNF